MRSTKALLAMASIVFSAACGQRDGAKDLMGPTPSISVSVVGGPSTVPQYTDVNLTATQTGSTGVISWSVDGVLTGTTGKHFSFMPENEGSYKICASAGSLEGCQTITATKLEMVMQFYVARNDASSAVPESTIVCTWENSKRGLCFNVGSDGKARLSGAFLKNPSTSFLVEGSGLSPLLFTVDKKNYGKEAVGVIPTSQWAITKGEYTGTTVNLSLEKAFEKSGVDGGSFFEKILIRLEDGSFRASVSSFNRDALPVPVVLDRSSGHDFTLTDSMNIWRGFRRFESLLGETLFRAEVYDPSKWTPENSINIEVNLDHERYADGVGTGSVNGQKHGGRIIYGPQITNWAFDDVRTTIHEIGHVFGLGHHCGWKSRMSYGCSTDMSASVLTPEDVAHLQMLMKASDLQAKRSALYGLSEAKDAVVALAAAVRNGG